MSFHTITRTIAACALGAVLAAGAGVAPRLLAQAPAPIDLNAADAIRRAVEQQEGQRVRLKLISGQDVEGRVARVGTNAVAMTELTGMELFEATVRVDQIAAVIVRRAAK